MSSMPASPEIVATGAPVYGGAYSYVSTSAPSETKRLPDVSNASEPGTRFAAVIVATHNARFTPAA